MNSVTHDWSWSNRFLPQIKQIIGPHLLTTSPIEVDRNEAADLVVLAGRDLTIAVRVRRTRYVSYYSSQFTLRLKRPSGAKTEFEKIADGWADWMFYGFCENEPSPKLAVWHLIDLDRFRAALIRRPHRLKRGEKVNPDGTSFVWFDLGSFTPSILIASSHSELS